MDRSLWAVMAGTFTLRFSTGLTGAMLGVYLAKLPEHGGPEIAATTLGLLSASFFLSELVLSPAFGILSDRIGHHRVMLFGPVFGAIAVILTGLTTNLFVLGGTRLLEGASTAASVPSILGYIAIATATSEVLRGKAAARFEGATLAGIGVGIAIAPLLFAAYPLYLWIAEDDPWQFLHAQRLWSRHLSPAGPLGGIWDGLRAGWAGVEQLASGSHTHVYWTPVQDADPLRVAVLNLEALAFLVLFVVLTVIAWRRFGAPYGLFAALSLAIPLSVPSERWPLLSLPRFGLTIFPLFLALAVVGGRPRAHTAIVAVSSLLLGVSVAQWALWQWVA